MRQVHLNPVKQSQRNQPQRSYTYYSAMNIPEGALRQLQTYVLSQQERDNKSLNFIGGFQIMDDDFRIVVLEGLSERGLKELEQVTPILEPNTYFHLIKRGVQNPQEQPVAVQRAHLLRVRPGHKEGAPQGETQGVPHEAGHLQPQQGYPRVYISCLRRSATASYSSTKCASATHLNR